MNQGLRVLRLKRVIEIQQEIFDMSLEWGTVWQRDGSAPKCNKIPDLLTLLVEARVILEKQVKDDCEDGETEEFTNASIKHH
jgi:hypothetical protein